MSNYPLADLRVLDFSRVLSGPFAGRMLSDLGADVVKIEPPEGDVTRYWGKVIGGLPGYFHQQNVGKRNICIDLRAEGASELVLELAKHADIVIENFRGGVMDRLGVGYEQLSAVNPKIIMLSISGYGNTGPEKHRPAYAPVIHAESGFIKRMSQTKNTHLTDVPLSVADTNAGLHGLVGVLSALHMRERTGKGQHIDIAMLDTMIATDDHLHYDLDSSRGSAPLPNEIWELAFGAVLISTDFRMMFKRLTTISGLVDPSTPDMELEEKIRVRRQAVADFFATLDTRDKFSDAMAAVNIAWGDVLDPRDVADHPTVKARGTFAWVDDRAGGERRVTQSPYRFSNAQSGVRGPAAHRGEHYVEVMNDWLKLNADQAEALRQQGVLVFDPDWEHH